MYLNTQTQHKVFYQVHGNPKGIPVLVVHGGPGSGCNITMLDYFNLNDYLVVLVDQRGCGKSTPHANIENNTTQDLINDFEAIRVQLKIKQWLLFGGSWGSTLSLVYAIQFPKRIIALVLRGVFLARPHEINWLLQEGASYMHPHAWQEFIKPLTLNERNNILASYYSYLTNPDIKVQQLWAKRFTTWEISISYLRPKKVNIEAFSLSLARLECHYLINKCFLTNNYILSNIDVIKDIKMFIVQGKYDLVCPPSSAYELQQAHGNAKLFMVHAGHSAAESLIKNKLSNIMQTNLEL